MSSVLWSRAIRVMALTFFFAHALPAEIPAWTNIGPDGGVPVQRIVIDPSAPSNLFAIVDYAAIWKSTDGGLTWSPVGFSFPGRQVLALAADPRFSGVLYVGTDLGGVYKTVDAGATWIRVSGSSTGGVGSLAIDSSGRVFAGVGDRVFRSTDGGSSWTSVSGALGGSVVDLDVDPTRPDRIFAGTYAEGLFRSLDGGDSWSRVLGGHLIPVHVAVSSATPGTAYAMAQSDGLFRSADGGDSWTRVTSPPSSHPAFNVFQVVPDPHSDETVYAATDRGVFRSRDRAVSWTRLWDGLTTIVGRFGIALALDAENPSVLYASTGFGLFKSQDAGVSWVLRTGDLRRITVGTLRFAPATKILYAATNFGIFRRGRRERSWSFSGEGMSTPHVTSLAVAPSSPATLYAGTISGAFRSDDGGEHWVRIPGLSGAVSALVVDPRASSTVYAQVYSSGCPTAPPSGFPMIGPYSGGIFKSTDGGEHWRQVHSFCTWGRGAMAVDPQSPSIIYAAASLAGVFRSPDGGETWEASNQGLDTSEVYEIAIDPLRSGIIYAGGRNGVFRSIDGATLWSRVSEGLPNRTVLSLVIDPAFPSTLYAGVERSGVFRSTNGGSSWAEYSGLFGHDAFSLAFDPTSRVLHAGTREGVFATPSLVGGNPQRPGMPREVPFRPPQ